MFGKNSEKKKEPQLYYLLPGMGKMARQRFFRNLKISIVVGLLVAIVVVVFLFYMNKLEGF
jgi:hypothetical protein